MDFINNGYSPTRFNEKLEKNLKIWGVLIKHFTPNVLNYLQTQSFYCIAKYYVRVFLGVKMLLPMFYN